MKSNIISKLLLSLSLVFVLGSAITQVRGQGIDPIDPIVPGVSIHSTTDSVSRGNIGAFVLAAKQLTPASSYYPYVNFSVSGTAIPGVDYVALVSPTKIGQTGYGVILIKTLPNPRASSSNQAYSVVVTMNPGAGYAVGTPSSATMWIKPCSTSSVTCR